MRGLLFLRMYDPAARKFWLQPFSVHGKSNEEIAAKMAKIKARHTLWKGEERRG